MKFYLLYAIGLLYVNSSMAQTTAIFSLKDAKTNEPLTGASIFIKDLKRGASTDIQGIAKIGDIPSGNHLVEFRYIGYDSRSENFVFPIQGDTAIVRLIPSQGEELGEVTVSTTRSSRTIADIPTRVEVIAGEELDEKGNMKPGDIRMLLNESTGIQTQQTSATSANASIRIQGLDGRYTQILKDGFPLYAGAASGLGLLQIPPLDLRQVEVIKGSSSTLYGGGAIAGLVNLISKTPGTEKELNFILNGTSAGGLDVSAFYSQRYGLTGVTLFAARNSNLPYAPENTDLTAIPDFTRYTLNPKLFVYLTDKTTLSLGLNSSFETRTGGDLHYLQGETGGGHSFFERNKSDRLSGQFSLSTQAGEHTSLNVKSSLSYFNRSIQIPSYQFGGIQYSSFSEASVTTVRDKSEWIAGLNLWTDEFKEKNNDIFPLRDYGQTTIGAFLQNLTKLNSWLEIESGLRADRVSRYGFALLPRISALIKPKGRINSRIGGGLGYKTPTIFTEESERIQYRDVLPVSPDMNKLERSAGINWDINYRVPLFNERAVLSINQLFFYTYLNNPLQLEKRYNGDLQFINSTGHMDSRGMETNLKLSYQDFKLFLGYTFTDARLHENGLFQINPLTARHRLNNVLMYEKDEKWKLGGEAYYYSTQLLNDGAKGKPYWMFGFMAERLWEKFSLYINFENFTDTRQTRFDSIYTGSISNPVFRDIYAPLDGFVVNGGVKLRF